MYPTAVPPWVAGYLFPGERIVIAMRANPIAFVIPIVHSDPAYRRGLSRPPPTRDCWVRGIVWVLWGLSFLWQGWKIFTWWRQYFVVTDHRVMLITSLVEKNVAMLPLTKVTDMRLHQTIFGRLFGYGAFIVQSAGQDQALSRIEFIPYPKEILKKILIPKTYSRR